MQGVELVDAETGTPDADRTARTALRARQLGLLVAYVGMDSNVLEITPPLTIPEPLLEEGVARLGRAIREAEQVDERLLAQFVGW